MADDVVDTIA
jgi:coiled-coil domain-containing protein 39